MRNLRINTKAQSILEYVIIFTVIIGAVIAGTVFIKKSLTGGGATVTEGSLFGKTGKVIEDFTGELGKLGQPKAPVVPEKVE